MGVLHTSDLVEFAEIKEGKEGLEGQRGFEVIGLSGNPDQKVLEAITVPGIPLIGEVHPTISILAVVEKNFQPQGASIGVVLVRYKQLNADEQDPGENTAPIISIGTTVQEDIVNVDTDGDFMPLFFTELVPTKIGQDENGDPKYQDKPNKLDPVNATANVQFPQTTLTFTRREVGSPFLKDEEYAGTINSRGFFQLPKHFWLCTGISGNSNDGGRTFVVNYNFQRCAKGTTWDPMLVYEDPETNEIITRKNLDGGTGPLALNGKKGNSTNDPSEVGIRRFQVYPEKDFNALNLDFGQGAAGGAGIFISKPGTTRLRFPPLGS